MSGGAAGASASSAPGGGGNSDGQGREGSLPPRSSTPGPVRAPSAGRVRPEPVAATLPFPAPSGHTVLPLQVNSIGASLGRPRTPTVQRTPKVGADAKELQPSNGNGIENSAPSGSNNGTPARTSGSSSSSTAMANSNINPAQGNGNLTTVISSALDYKRFLDRRKHMIQQQVETAQQASGPGQIRKSVV